MCIWSDLVNEMHYINAWLKKLVFNLDLNWGEFEPRTLSGRLFQSLGGKCENALPPLVELDKAQSFESLKIMMYCKPIEDQLNTQKLNHLGPYIMGQ